MGLDIVVFYVKSQGILEKNQNSTSIVSRYPGLYLPNSSLSTEVGEKSTVESQVQQLWRSMLETMKYFFTFVSLCMAYNYIKEADLL
jgi:hypothetical protein